MHFVLWGLHQRVEWLGSITGCKFQCTSCFGVFINSPAPSPLRPRTLVSMHFVLWGLHQQRIHRQQFKRNSFNALRALGSSSTTMRVKQQFLDLVSMHFVLWGLHQPRKMDLCISRVSFNALRALGSSSTRF